MKSVTPDWVEQELVAAEAVIAKARARQVELLRVADRMQLPTADGCKSLSEWVAGRLDVSSETAHRLVATASRLADAPELETYLAGGTASFDRVEATSRIPEHARSDRLLGLDIQGLRRLAARYRGVERAREHQQHRSQHLVIQPNLDESSWSLWGELDGYSGAVVDKVLAERADQIPDLPDGRRPGLGYRRAVALTSLCEETSSDTGESGPLISVFLDGQGASTEAGVPVGAETIDRLACVGSLEVILDHPQRPLAQGRRTRVIPPRLRRFIIHRDGGCTADGCTSRYRLQPHHIIPWSRGGPTDPENLTTLCWFHHHVVIHGWGYRIDASLGPNRLRFRDSSTDPPHR